MKTVYVDLRARAEKATPGPWQRSYVAETPTTKHWPVEAINEAMQHELRVVRGPGVVGEPSCNVVLVVDSQNHADRDFIAAANPATIMKLLDTIAALARLATDHDCGRYGLGPENDCERCAEIAELTS